MNRPTRPCPFGCPIPVFVTNNEWHVHHEADGSYTILHGCPTDAHPEDLIPEEIEEYD